MIVKSKDGEGHITNLRKFFERIKEYRLRLNLQKCPFGVMARKLLGFFVSDRGIEVDPSKIKAILDMPPPNKRILRTVTVHQPIHCQTHIHLWTYLQGFKKEWTPCIEWWMSESCWTYQGVSSPSAYIGTTETWKVVITLSHDHRKYGWEYACIRGQW